MSGTFNVGGIPSLFKKITFEGSTGTGMINLPDAGNTAADGITWGGQSIFRLNSTQIAVSNNFNAGGGGVQLTSIGIILLPSTLTGSSDTSALSITQTWNTTGSPTLIFANVTNTASGANANLMDLQVGGVSQFKVNKVGSVTSAGTITAPNLNSLAVVYLGNFQSGLRSSSSGVIRLFNSAETDFNRLQFGGTTNLFPSIQRSGAAIRLRLADDSGDADLFTQSITSGHILPKTGNAHDLGSSGARWKDVWVGAIESRRIKNVAALATDIPVISKGFTGQTANLFEAQDVSNNVLSYIKPDGSINFGTTTGTGRINLPDGGTTAADGIQFGTGLSNLYRASSGVIKTDGAILASFALYCNTFQSTNYNTNILFQGFNNLAFTPNSLLGSSATSALSITQTWNTTGSPTAIFANITNTASGASANLMDLQVGGVSQFIVTKAGVLTTASFIGVGTSTPSNNLTVYGGNADVTIKMQTHSTGQTNFDGFNFSVENTTNHVYFNQRENADIYFLTSNTTRMLLNNTGSLSIGASASNARSILDVQSTTKGFLPPRMTTTQRNAIATVSGDAGLTIFNTTTTKLEVWDGTTWQQAW